MKNALPYLEKLRNPHTRISDQGWLRALSVYQLVLLVLLLLILGSVWATFLL